MAKPQDEYEDDVALIRDHFLYAIMRHHPDAVPVKGTSVYAIIHAASLLFAPIIAQLSPKAREEVLSLLQDDNEPPVSEEEIDQARDLVTERRSLVGRQIDVKKAKKLGLVNVGKPKKK